MNRNNFIVRGVGTDFSRFGGINKCVPLVITGKRFEDQRGSYNVCWDKDFMDGVTGGSVFVQESFSTSSKYVFRGLHRQEKPYSQGKLIRVVNGMIIDFIFGECEDSKVLTSIVMDNPEICVWIPPGYYHGFFALTDDVHFDYLVTERYSKNSENGIYLPDDLILNTANTLGIFPESAINRSAKDESFAEINWSDVKISIDNLLEV